MELFLWTIACLNPTCSRADFDGDDVRIFAYDAELQQWRHIPDWATFQAMGFYWCNVTAADAGFFERITIGSPFPASGTPERDDHPNCQS